MTSTYSSDEELIDAIKVFEKNGGEFSSEMYRFTSNDMIINCRNGMSAVSQFIADAQQTNLYRSIITTGLYVASLVESHFERDTLIIGESIFDCLQWEEALKWTGQVKCITKKNQILTGTPITIITKKLMSDYPLNGLYYRVLAPFGLKHRLKCMYNYSMSDYCFTENEFIFNEPYAVRNIRWYETKILFPIGKIVKKDDYFCSICLEIYEKVYQIKPCRHTLCFTCYEQANLVKCHMCRGMMNSMSVLYNEEKMIPPPDIKSVVLSLSESCLVFSNDMSKEKDTFEKVYLRYLKNPKKIYFCKWPQNKVSRFYGKTLTDLIFIITPQEKLPYSDVIDSLCVNPINIHILYTDTNQKNKWENLLSTNERDPDNTN